MGSFFSPELARSSEIKHEFVLFESTLGGAGRSSIRRCFFEGVTHLVRVSIP